MKNKSIKNPITTILKYWTACVIFFTAFLITHFYIHGFDSYFFFLGGALTVLVFAILILWNIFIVFEKTRKIK